MERDSPIAESLIAAARQLSARLSTLTFAPPVSHLYNPLTYAWAVHERTCAAMLRVPGGWCSWA
jgi:hypothetical protein